MVRKPAEIIVSISGMVRGPVVKGWFRVTNRVVVINRCRTTSTLGGYRGGISSA